MPLIRFNTAIYSKKAERLEKLDRLVRDLELKIKTKEIIANTKQEIISSLKKVLNENWYTFDEFRNYYKHRTLWLLSTSFERIWVSVISWKHEVLKIEKPVVDYTPIERRSKILPPQIDYSSKWYNNSYIYIKWRKYWHDWLEYFKKEFSQKRGRNPNNEEELRNFLDRNTEIIENAVRFIIQEQ